MFRMMAETVEEGLQVIDKFRQRFEAGAQRGQLHQSVYQEMQRLRNQLHKQVTTYKRAPKQSPFVTFAEQAEALDAAEKLFDAFWHWTPARDKTTGLLDETTAASFSDLCCRKGAVVWSLLRLSEILDEVTIGGSAAKAPPATPAAAKPPADPSKPTTIPELVNYIQTFKTALERADEQKSVALHVLQFREVVSSIGFNLPDDLKDCLQEIWDKGKDDPPLFGWHRRQMVARLEKALFLLTPATLTPRKPNPRDKFCYDQRSKGRSLKEILAAVNKRTKWEPIDTVQGVSAAAKRHAKANELPWPVNRR
jgi:hypothetical protein